MSGNSREWCFIQVERQRPLHSRRHGLGACRSFRFGRSDRYVDNDEPGNALIAMLSDGKEGVDFGSLKSGLFSQGMGRGLYTTRLIFSGQRICSITLSEMITAKSALESIKCMLPSEDDWNAVSSLSDDPWAVLALYVSMISSDEYERSPCQHQYSELLPRDISTVLEWEQKDVDLLRGSYVHGIAEEIRQSADDTIHDIQQANVPHVDETVLRWSLSVLLSRLVRLETISGHSILALCPGLDFLNMSCDSTSFISLDKDDTVFLKSDRWYTPGEQIFISYGQKTSGELYLSYGFYPEENPHHACLFSIHAGENHTTLFKAMNIPTKKIFPLRLEGLPEGIMRYAAIISLEEIAKDSVARLHELSADMDLPADDQKRALAWLSKTIRQRLSRFSMSQEECKYMIQGTPRDHRHNIIARLVLQDQRILGKSLFAVDSMRRLL